VDISDMAGFGDNHRFIPRSSFGCAAVEHKVEYGRYSICILSHSVQASAMTWDVEFHTEATNMKNLDRIRKQLPAARRRRIAARA
jgi:hypothetical protein